MNLEYPNCIVCERDDFTDYLTIEDESGCMFHLKKCKCSLVLTSPRPCSISIGEYYSESYLPHSNIQSNHSRFLNKIFRYISFSWKLNLIKSTVSQKNKILDIGGGDGALALYLNNKLAPTSVYEKNIECVKHMKKIGLAAFDNLKALPNNKYNVVTLFHSLEHIHDIEELFFNINRVTTKGAKMIIAVPNINAGEIKFLSNKWAAWDVPRHLYHFSFETLELLLNKYDWEIVGSKNMLQDTLFNIYMSLKGNIIKKIFIFILLSIYSFSSQIFSSKKRSTNLVLCQKK